MSDIGSDGNKIVECREVTIGQFSLTTEAAELLAKKLYPDCDVLLSNYEDGFGGRILLFTKKPVVPTQGPEQ